MKGYIAKSIKCETENAQGEDLIEFGIERALGHRCLLLGRPQLVRQNVELDIGVRQPVRRVHGKQIATSEDRDIQLQLASR
jgi:hypothetical protein